MSFFETLFGGTDTSAQDEQIRENRRARQFVREEGKRSRSDAKRLFSRARTDRRRGFQGALDILGQSVPQQVGSFQAGNVGAQEALLAGLPQIRNAILGAPTDLSGLTPTRLDFDPSFANVRLPRGAGSKGPQQTPPPVIREDQGPFAQAQRILNLSQNGGRR